MGILDFGIKYQPGCFACTLNYHPLLSWVVELKLNMLWFSLTCSMYLCMCISCMIQSDLDRSQNSRSHSNLKNTDVGNKLMHKPVASDQRPVLRKSLSLKGLRAYDGYSVSVIIFRIVLVYILLWKLVAVIFPIKVSINRNLHAMFRGWNGNIFFYWLVGCYK